MRALLLLLAASTAYAEKRVALAYPTTLYATAEAARNAKVKPVDPAAPGPEYQLTSAALVAHDGTIATLRLVANKADCVTSHPGFVDIVVYVPESQLVTRLASAQAFTEEDDAWYAAAGTPLVRKGGEWVLLDETMTALKPASVKVTGDMAVDVTALPRRKAVRAPKCPAETKEACKERESACRKKATSLQDYDCIPYSCSKIPDYCQIAAGTSMRVGAASTATDVGRLAFALTGPQTVEYTTYGCVAARGTLSAPAVFDRRGGGAAIGGGGAGNYKAPALVTLKKGTKLYWADGTAAGVTTAELKKLEKELTPGNDGRRCYTETWLDTPLCFSGGSKPSP